MKLLNLFCVPVLLAACQMPPLQAQQAPRLDLVFDRVHEAVVTLRTTSRKVVAGSPSGLTTVGGIGSGVLISAEGDILTAAHVVQTADEVLIEFPGGEILRGLVVSSLPHADVALVRAIGELPAGVEPAVLGDSARVRVGEQVFVVGAPLGVSHTLTVGHISARRSESSLFSAVEAMEFFQTDAAINQGNSGGPMFDMRGEVIGIVSHIVTRSGGNQGLGFAVTSNVVRRLMVDGRPFWSGLDGLLLEGRLAEVLNTPEGRSGLLVQQVAKNSLAEALGLKGGDVMASFDGVDVQLGGDIVLEVQGVPVERANITRIRDVLTSVRAGEELHLTILRRGQLLRITTKLPES